jgi:hypothetical protein
MSKGKKIVGAALLLAFGPLAPAQAADVGVSISIGQPGFYGHIDIGNAPQPRLIYAQPVLIERARGQGAPIYLRVPPGHEKDWRKHCKHYDACGRPVYFVRDDWYRDQYVPHYERSHGEGRGRDRDDEHGRGHGRDKEKHGRGHGRDRD